MKNKKIKILDLFAGSQSVKKALGSQNIDYVGVDITNFNGKVDNSLIDMTNKYSVDNLIKWCQNNNWYPKIIWASPPCQTFSRATGIAGGTIAFEKIVDQLKLRENWENVAKHKSYKSVALDIFWQSKQLKKGVEALKMVDNTIRIIEALKPNIWIIENPFFGLLKNYLWTKLSGHSNRADYCQYGMPYKKSTLLFSNIFFNLKKCNHKQHAEVMSGDNKKLKKGQKHSYTDNYNRSKVPALLIKDLFNYE